MGKSETQEAVVLRLPPLTADPLDGSSRHVDVHLSNEARLGLGALHRALAAARPAGARVPRRREALDWLLTEVYRAAEKNHKTRLQGLTSDAKQKV